MFDFFQPIVDVFNFIVGLLETITQGIYDITTIIGSIINLVLSITKILPNPLYPCFISFLTLYSTIFIYKIIRKG